MIVAGAILAAHPAASAAMIVAASRRGRVSRRMRHHIQIAARAPASGREAGTAIVVRA
jgi:hypothetical protein